MIHCTHGVDLQRRPRRTSYGDEGCGKESHERVRHEEKYGRLRRREQVLHGVASSLFGDLALETNIGVLQIDSAKEDAGHKGKIGGRSPPTASSSIEEPPPGKTGATSRARGSLTCNDAAGHNR